MPSYSGLWDGEHGEAYAAMPRADALPPHQRGIVRSLMQKRGMHGHVAALGRNSPSSITQVYGDRNTQTIRGTFDYATRTDVLDYEYRNAGTEIQAKDGIFPVQPMDSIDRPVMALETDMLHTYDTTLRNGHPADASMNGVTSKVVAEAISDGT
jgi:hypothetical protein